MADWKNLDELTAYKELEKLSPVDLKTVMAGESGAERVKNCSIPMAEGLAYNYAAKAVDGRITDQLEKLAAEAQLAEKFEELYNGAVINTGEKTAGPASSDQRTAGKTGYGGRSGQARLL